MFYEALTTAHLDKVALAEEVGHLVLLRSERLLGRSTRLGGEREERNERTCWINFASCQA
jgi:hypothetical protein